MHFFQLRLSINRTSLLRLNESQAVSLHQGLLTLPGTINICNMGWRLASTPGAISSRTDFGDVELNSIASSSTLVVKGPLLKKKPLEHQSRNVLA
ncbi:hypothetical protein TNCV_224671 [Trichonephila clavipes]|nr:hypothetical protein TNCV_224671 [Trichonephila clavipes]